MTTTAKFFRTAKGSHVHADFECANQRRSIHLGDPIECAADAMAPCEHCCPTGLVSAHAAKVAVEIEAKCADMRATHPQRIESTCRTCGKRGKVNRRNGQIRH